MKSYKLFLSLHDEYEFESEKVSEVMIGVQITYSILGQSVEQDADFWDGTKDPVAPQCFPFQHQVAKN